MGTSIMTMICYHWTNFQLNFGYLTNKFEGVVAYFQAWIELQFVGSIQNIANLK